MYLCLILLNATIIFISPNPESSPSLLPGRGQLIMDGSPSSSSKRRKREAEEKNCPSVAATAHFDQSIDLSVKMARKLIIIVPSSSPNSNSNLICKEVRLNLMEALSDQKDLHVEAKVIDEISDLELGDIICIVALDEAVSVS